MKKLNKNKIKRFIVKNSRTIGMITLCILLSSIFVLIFSYSTSPVYGDYYSGYYSEEYGYSGDSAQFQTIGESWLNGRVPYRDIFDHKGPIIFLIDAIGYSIKWRSGIVVIQIISLSVTLYYIFKICSLASKKFVYGIIVNIICLIFLTRSYADGNSVQEYALPFITSSTYYITRYLSLYKKEKSGHSAYISILYGLTGAFCLLTQATSAIVPAIGVFSIYLLLAKNKQWKVLGKNILFALLGFAGLLLPFIIYFATENCLYEFVYATLLFNFAYAGKIGSWLHGASGEAFVNFTITYFPFLTIFFTALLAALRKKYAYSAFLLASGLLEGYLFLTAQSFDQYAIITLMQLPLLINELYLSRTDNSHGVEIFSYALSVIVIVMSYNQVLSFLQYIPDKRHCILSASQVGYEELLERNMPAIKTGTFVAFGEKEFKDLYLKYNILPDNKYFVIQPWHSMFSDKVKDEVQYSFANNNTEFILVDEYGKKNIYNINDILENRYTLIDQEGEFELYQLNVATPKDDS